MDKPDKIFDELKNIYPILAQEPMLEGEIREHIITIRITDIIKTLPELVEQIYDRFDVTIEKLETIFNDNHKGGGFRWKIKVIPPFDYKLSNRNSFNTKNLGKMLKIRGTIQNVSPIYRRMSKVVFGCEFCHSVREVNVTSNAIPKIYCYKEQEKFGKSLMRVQTKIFTDYQTIFCLEQNSIIKPNEIPMAINCEYHLCYEDADGISNSIIGEDKDLIGHFITTDEGKPIFYVNNILPSNEIIITDKDKEQITEKISQPKGIENLCAYICRDIHGMDLLQKAVLCVCIGLKKQDNLLRGRASNLHIAIIGSPSMGKSDIVKRFCKYHPRIVFKDGSSMTRAAIVGTAEKNPTTTEWEIRWGLMKMCDVLAMDEFKRLDKLVIGKMLSALAENKLTLSMASVPNAETEIECNLIAIGNPIAGDFDANVENLRIQLDLDPAFLSRMAMIIVLQRKQHSPEDKKKIRQHIIYGLQRENKADWDELLVKKYFILAKSMDNPTSPQPILKMMDKYMDTFTEKYAESDNRFFINFKKFCMALARAKLHSEVMPQDVQDVIQMMELLSHNPMKSVFGKISQFDVTNILSNVQDIPTTSSSQITYILEIIESKKEISHEELLKIATSSEISSRRLDEIIQNLMRKGDIFEPRNGLFRIMQ